jgi:hypothetical protein
VEALAVIVAPGIRVVFVDGKRRDFTRDMGAQVKSGIGASIEPYGIEQFRASATAEWVEIVGLSKIEETKDAQGNPVLNAQQVYACQYNRDSVESFEALYDRQFEARP